MKIIIFAAKHMWDYFNLNYIISARVENNR